MTRALSIFLFLVLAGCGGARPDTSQQDGSRSDAASEAGYGLSPDTAIRVGATGAEGSGGPARERAYLDRLRGPSGAPMSYEREGSCCGFRTPNGMMGTGLLDMYQVWGAGLDGRMTVYLNMYDPPDPASAGLAPPGMTLAPE